MCPPQVGTLSTSLAFGSMTTKKMLHKQMKNTIVLSEGALVTSNEADRPTISALKGLSLSMATLLRETLYFLQDGIIAELGTRESPTI